MLPNVIGPDKSHHLVKGGKAGLVVKGSWESEARLRSFSAVMTIPKNHLEGTDLRLGYGVKNDCAQAL
jgi:hypothetical protein